jgi:hypothetical protein
MPPPNMAILLLPARHLVNGDSPDSCGDPISHNLSARPLAPGRIQEPHKEPTGSSATEMTGRTNTHHGSFLPGVAGVRDFSSR